MNWKTLVCLSHITLVASLGLAAHAQTFSVIHAFDGQNGAFPFGGVTLRDGSLYGTTYYRDFQEATGTVYQSKHVGSDWITTPIFIFPTDGSGGDIPEARVVFGPDGALYGTTGTGGYGAGGGWYSVSRHPHPSAEQRAALGRRTCCIRFRTAQTGINPVMATWYGIQWATSTGLPSSEETRNKALSIKCQNHEMFGPRHLFTASRLPGIRNKNSTVYTLSLASFSTATATCTAQPLQVAYTARVPFSS